MHTHQFSVMLQARVSICFLIILNVIVSENQAWNDIILVIVQAVCKYTSQLTQPIIVD